MDEKYWVIAWGDKKNPTFRGPYGKSDLEKSCKDAYGMVAANMMAIDLGTRIGPIRTASKMQPLYKIAGERFKTDRGIFRWNFTTQVLEKVADWKDEPFVRMFKTKLERYDANRPVSEQTDPDSDESDYVEKA